MCLARHGVARREPPAAQRAAAWQAHAKAACGLVSSFCRAGPVSRRTEQDLEVWYNAADGLTGPSGKRHGAATDEPVCGAAAAAAAMALSCLPQHSWPNVFYLLISDWREAVTSVLRRSGPTPASRRALSVELDLITASSGGGVPQHQWITGEGSYPGCAIRR